MNYSVPYSGFVADAPDNVRAEFIRKTYQIFFASLLVTVGVAWFCAQPAMLPKTVPLILPMAIAGLVVGFIMAFTQKKQGLNLFMLCLYSAIQGAVAGPLLFIVNRYAPGVPAQAGILTVAVFGGLTLYAMTSKKDFSFLGGMLFVGLIGLIVASIVMMFFSTPLMSMVYSVFGILIFSGFVLYDTSQIMQKMQPGEEVSGAISLYLDFINLFYFILRFLMELNRR
jgi:FtsH-binding integral membrane protein